MSETNWIQRIIAAIADLITRTKGLDDIHDKVGTIDAVTTDSLHGKLGTDTELADYSFYDLLGGNAFKTNALSAMLGAFTSAQNLKAILGDLSSTKRLGQILGLDETDTLKAILGAFTAAQNLKAILGDLSTTKNLGGILGAFTAAQNLKAILGDLTTTKNLGGILGNLSTTKNLGGILGALTTTDNLKGILGAYTTAANLKAAIDALALEATLGTHDTDIKALLGTIAGYLDTEIAAILADVTGIAGAAMRGTDNAALAANWTAALATALGNYTAARAGYLDNLSAGAAALEATLTAIKGGGWSNETLVAIKAAIDAITGAVSTDWKGSFNWDTSVYLTNEQDISALFSANLALTTRRKYSVKLDLTNIEADGSFVELYLVVKEKIDGTNYRPIDRKTLTKADIAANAEPGIPIDIPATSENIQITMQMDTALAGDATIYYAVVMEHLE